jgi:plasmid stability protein
MAMLQIRSLPDDVHETLRARAEREGLPMSALASRLLAEALSSGGYTLRRFLDDLDRARPPLDREVDVNAVMDEIRGEWPGEPGRSAGRA